MKETDIPFFMAIDVGDNDVHKVREELLAIDEIKMVHCLLGPDDMLCFGKVKAYSSLKGLLKDKINPMIEAQFTPIQRSETFMVVDHLGEDVSLPRYSKPEGLGVWVMCDLNISDASALGVFLRTNEFIHSVYCVTGRHDALVYVEAPDQAQLMQAIDVTIRNLRTLTRKGSRKALSRTDTRLVLM